MHTTNFLIAIIAATGVQALPQLAQRQARSALMNLYFPGGSNDCSGTPIATFEVQDTTGCQSVNRGQIGTARFVSNTFPSSCRSKSSVTHTTVYTLFGRF